MNRAERRLAAALERSGKRSSSSYTDRVHERIVQLMTTDGDHCSLCRGRFQHNHRSYGGVTSYGAVALVSECCASKLEVVITSGLYTSRPYAELHKQRNNGPVKELSSEQIEEVITAHQQRFAAIDELTDKVARQAGVPAEKMMLHHDDDDAAWKADDRTWFERNPTRSHRLRPVFPGEPSGRGNEAVPPGHELQVVVRQIEPGLRVRHSFFRNLEIDDFPDDEALLHALFDLVVENRWVSMHDLCELAQKYERCGAVS